MMRNMLVCAFVVAFFCVSGTSFANTGPTEMVLQAEKDKAKTPKPAVFPHKAHQEAFACAECHHTGKDGKQVAYTEGMEIQKCETCHFTGSGMPKKLETFKDAAHENCKSCHKDVAEKKPELAAKFKGCMPCHPKK